MVLKSELEQAYLLQQTQIIGKEEFTYRKNISDYFVGNHIEVISGIRRCGKSTLMKQLMLKVDSNIAYFNFEDSRVYDFELSDFQKLDEIIGNDTTTYFFDEIQNVESWEIFVRQLHDRGAKIFITGSNASLLSKELGTRLTGRHISHELFPFSYSEFLEHKKLENNLQSFEIYLVMGGFPEYLNYKNQEVLQTLVKDIVLRDIAIRYGIKSVKTLMDITLFLLSNIGKEYSANNITKSFSVGSSNSVSNYLAWLENSYLLFYLPKFSWSAKSISINPKKVYAIDNGLVMCNSLSFSSDTGRLIENMVYLHLRQSYSSIFYFREKGECDFVVFNGNACQFLIQVCDEVHVDNKAREINGLLEAMEFFKLQKGFIITKNQSDKLVFDSGKITLIPAYQFLINDLEKM